VVSFQFFPSCCSKPLLGRKIILEDDFQFFPSCCTGR
jgi:hypothetical protein